MCRGNMPLPVSVNANSAEAHDQLRKQAGSSAAWSSHNEANASIIRVLISAVSVRKVALSEADFSGPCLRR